MVGSPLSGRRLRDANGLELKRAPSAKPCGSKGSQWLHFLTHMLCTHAHTFPGTGTCRGPQVPVM